DNHVNNICSTWGKQHFKTFDGEVFQFPGLCEYNLVKDCLQADTFSVHIRREENDGNITMPYVVITISGNIFNLTKTKKYTKSCPSTQIFTYNHRRCQLTCSSLSSDQQSCTSHFLPVVGCFCPDGLYLNEKDTCVPKEECSCSYKGQNIEAGKSLTIDTEHCTGTCHVLIQKSTSTAPLQATKPLDHNDVSGCVSKCMCPPGQLNDGNDSCVKNESECPCKHNGKFYKPEGTVYQDCNLW
ncbi:hypothetical protein CCH79_00015341, partial [Gambusia affinis]